MTQTLPLLMLKFIRQFNIFSSFMGTSSAQTHLYKLSQEEAEAVFVEPQFSLFPTVATLF